MKVVILTSSIKGTASYHLSKLLDTKACEVVMVVYNKGEVLNRKKYFVKKARKIFSIGILGVINGLRMRKWFGQEIEKYITTKDIRSICKEYNIPFFEVETINSDYTLKLFIQSEAQLGISLGNGYISKKIFSIPQYGMINIHHEILPDYQNAQSVLWQLFNFSTSTGYTIHKIDDKIDTGEILFQEKVPIVFRETLRETVAFTCSKLYEASANGLVYILKNFQEISSNAYKQGKGKSYTTPSIYQYLKMYFNYKKLRN